jgi:hypothetical protein
MDGRASVYKQTHPSQLSLCFTREERRYLVKDFRDDAVRALCVDACLRAPTEKSLVQQQAIEGTPNCSHNGHLFPQASHKPKQKKTKRYEQISHDIARRNSQHDVEPFTKDACVF